MTETIKVAEQRFKCATAQLHDAHEAIITEGREVVDVSFWELVLTLLFMPNPEEGAWERVTPRDPDAPEAKAVPAASTWPRLANADPSRHRRPPHEVSHRPTATASARPPQGYTRSRGPPM